MPDCEYALILSTCKDAEEAERMAEFLVAEGAAACVSVIAPITSIYRWKGKVEKSTEAQLFVKTTVSQVDVAIETIKRLASYQCPEVIVLPIIAGSEEYLRWLDEATAGG